MNEVNKTLFIPLYGKAWVSRRGIILRDATAERIWDAERFPIRGKAASKWLAYNMAMRARVFDDWTAEQLARQPGALVLHIGCGLDSRCARVERPYALWLDCDLPEVIAVRRRYYAETERCQMRSLNAADPAQILALPEAETAVVVLEGLSMYLTRDELRGLLRSLQDKYRELHVLMDVYTEFGARASKYRNPVNEVGVTRLYGLDDLPGLLAGLRLRVRAEHSFTPARLIDELPPAERAVFKLLFTGKMYGRLYRLFELETADGPSL